MTILSYTLQTGSCISLIMHFSGMSQVQWLEFVSFISQFRTFFQWSGPVCCNRPPESEAYKTQPSFGAGILRLQVTSRMIAALHKILWLLDLMKLHMNDWTLSLFSVGTFSTNATFTSLRTSKGMCGHYKHRKTSWALGKFSSVTRKSAKSING